MTKAEKEQEEAFMYLNGHDPYIEKLEVQKLKEIQRKKEIDLLEKNNNYINQTIEKLQKMQKQGEELKNLVTKSVKGNYWINHFEICRTSIELLDTSLNIENIDIIDVKEKVKILKNHFDIGMKEMYGGRPTAENYTDPKTFLNFVLETNKYIGNIFQELKTYDKQDYTDNVLGSTRYQNDTDKEDRRKYIAEEFNEEYMIAVEKSINYSITHIKACLEECDKSLELKNNGEEKKKRDKEKEMRMWSISPQ